MTAQGHLSLEYEAIVDEEGKIVIPASVVEQVGAGKKAVVHVCLTEKNLSNALKEKNVSEEEIEAIARIQLESRDQVVKFLLSEGTLAKHVSFRSRSTRRERL
jgi:bifunctional DNA-binding transcriptional regulator/antitoxin component of YhaV-PrlF toxin-antitoxin module